MEGGGESLDPIMKELQDAALAVTVLNRRLLQTASSSLRRNTIQSSVETNTDPPRCTLNERSFAPKCHIGIHALDGHYTSTYQIAHCCATPTSSPQFSPEFPPQTHRPSRERGNFIIGGHGVHNNFYTTPCDSIPSWYERESLYSAEPHRVMEAFAQSLRRYPTCPERDSSEIVQKLLNYTQNKYLNRISKNQSRDNSPTESLSPENSLKNTNKAQRRTSRDFGSNTTNDLRFKLPYMRGRCFETYNNQSSSISKYREQLNNSYDYLHSPCPSKMTSPSKMTCSSRNLPPCKPKREYISQAPCFQHKPGYFNEVKKYIRDTIKQMYEEKPEVCPRIRSRYSRHKRKHHRIPDVEVEISGPSCSNPDAMPLISPVPSRSFPVYRPCPRKTISTKELACPYCMKPLPCFCKQFLEDIESQAGVKEVIYNWLQELPINADDTPCNKAQREELIDKLAEDIKNLQNDPDFENKARDAIKKCLQYLPIWYPSNSNEQDVFKKQIIDDLVNRIRKYLVSSPLRDVIRKKLTSLQYIQDVDLEKFVEKFKTQIMPLLDNPEQLKARIAELVLDLPIANKNEALSSIVEGFITDVSKLPKVTETQLSEQEQVRDISDSEIEHIAIEWLENSPELPSEVEPAKIKNLVQKLYNTQSKHLGDQAEREQMNKDTIEWIDSLLKSSNEILDTNTKQNLATNLIDKIKGAKAHSKETPKTRKRWSHEAMLQSIINEIRDLVKDIPGLGTKEKVDSVTKKIATVLTNKSNELSTNTLGIIDEIADILKTDADMSETDTDNLASAIVNRVKGMAAAKKRTSFHSKRAFSTEDLEKEVFKLVDATFIEHHLDVNNSLENILVDFLLDEIVRGHNDHTREDIISAMKDADISENVAVSIADTLLGKSKDLEVMIMRKSDLDFGTSTPKRKRSDFKFRKNSSVSSIHKQDDDHFYLHTSSNTNIHHHENEQRYATDAKEKIRGWIDDMPISSKEKSYLRPNITGLTNDIMDRQKYLQLNPKVSHKPQEELDNLRYQVFRWVNKIPEMEDKSGPVIERTEDLMDKLAEIVVPILVEPSQGSERRGTVSDLSPQISNESGTHSTGTKRKRSDFKFRKNSSVSSIHKQDDDHFYLHTSSNTNIHHHENEQRYATDAKEKIRGWIDDMPISSKEKSYLRPNITGLTNDIMDRQKYLQLNPKVSHKPQEELDNLRYQVFRWVNKIPEMEDKSGPVIERTEDLMDKLAEIVVPILVEPSQGLERRGTVSDLSPQISNESGTHSTGTNTSLKRPHVKKTANELFSSIEKWSKNLPIKGDTPEEKEKINKIKKKIANRLTQKVGELNMNPEAFRDDFMFDELFEDEIDDLISEIPELKKELPQLKKGLMSKVKDARRVTHVEMAGKAYKQQLRDALSKTLPPETLNEEEQALFEVLKDDVADGFLNVHYADETSNTAAEHRKQVREEIDKFTQNYLSNHPNSPIDTKTLNKNLYEALISIPPPKEGTEGIRNEVELIRTKDTCDGWAKENQLFKDRTPAEKLYKTKALSVLATKIKDLEELKEQSPDFDYDDALKKEINKWVTKTAKVDRDDIGKITDELISQLKDTEPSRHVEATARHSIGPEYYLSSPDLIEGMKSKSKTLQEPPGSCCIPPSSLSVEDKLYMEKMRQRNQEGYSGSDSVSSGTQAGQQSIQAVGSQAIGSQAVLTPQVIIKEYYWDPETCKFCQLPASGIVPPCAKIPSPVMKPPCVKPLAFQESSPCTADQVGPTCPQIPDMQESVPCPSFLERSTCHETAPGLQHSGGQEKTSCPRKTADQVSATCPRITSHQESHPCPQRPIYQESVPYCQRPVYPESPPCAYKPTNQETVPCPGMSTYQENPRLAQRPAYQESAPCSPSPYQGTPPFPQMPYYPENYPYPQRPAYHEPPLSTRMPPIYHERPRPKRPNSPKSSLSDRPFRPFPRRPVIRPKMPCEIPLIERSTNTNMPPRSPKTTQQSQTWPRAMPSWREYATDIPCAKKLRICTDLDDSRWMDEELDDDDDDEDDNDEDDDDDDEFVNDSEKARYSCNCEERRSSGRSRKGGKNEMEDNLKKCSKCCGIQCPYPSYCYFKR